MSKLDLFCKLLWEYMTLEEANIPLYNEYIREVEEHFDYCEKNSDYYQDTVKQPIEFLYKCFPKKITKHLNKKAFGYIEGHKELSVAFDMLGIILDNQFLVKKHPEIRKDKNINLKVLSREVNFKDKFKYK